MPISRLAGYPPLRSPWACTSANATTLEEVKEQGYIRVATANEVPTPT
jgi:polar amino acid transport system substrate-binding protein